MSVITVTVEWSMGIFHTHTSLVVLIGFILPLVMNGLEFILRTIKEYHGDLVSREKASNKAKDYEVAVMQWKEKGSLYRDRPTEPSEYRPHLIVGHILARLIGTVTPFVNFFVMLANMDRVFDWIGKGFRFLGSFFSIPLVPKR